MATTCVFIGAFAPVARRMSLPRVLLTDFPMGRPVGAPGDAARHREVVTAALSLVETAVSPGTLVGFGTPYRFAPGGREREPVNRRTR